MDGAESPSYKKLQRVCDTLRDMFDIHMDMLTENPKKTSMWMQELYDMAKYVILTSRSPIH